MVSASAHSFYPNLLPDPWAFSESNVIKKVLNKMSIQVVQVF